MFDILNESGHSIPQLVCEICDDPIDDVALAAAVYNAATEHGNRVGALCVHKGRIGGRTCHDEADANIERHGGIPGWQEMRDHLMHLVVNSGLAMEQQLEAARRNPRR